MKAITVEEFATLRIIKPRCSQYRDWLLTLKTELDRHPIILTDDELPERLRTVKPSKRGTRLRNAVKSIWGASRRMAFRTFPGAMAMMLVDRTTVPEEPAGKELRT